MTSVNPPIQYFIGIIYNPQFWTDTSNSTLYLGRIGTPTSVASNTTFNGTLTTNGISNTGTITTTDLTVTNVIQGTALNADNILSQNNNANATHYITYTDLSTNGYGMLQKHAGLNFNPNTEVLTADNIVGAVSMTTPNPPVGDNSTRVPTTNWITDTTHTWLSSATQVFNCITRFYAPNDTTSISIAGGLRAMTASSKNNVCIGNSLNALTTGDFNIAIGNSVLPLITTVSQNIGIGHRALEKITATGGSVNIAIGYISGYVLTSGSWNSFFSTASGSGFSSGNYNFCMGFQAMTSYNSPTTTFATNVNRNLALGAQAIYAVSNNIADNVAIGFRALGNPPNTATANYTGNQNTAIGSYAGYGLDGTGSNGNVFIGYNCGVVNGVASTWTTTTYTNITAINTGVIASPASNNVYIGNSSVTSNTLYGTLNVPNISFTGTLNTISTTVFGYLSGVTSNIQTQINNILNGTSSFASLPVSNKVTLTSNALVTGSTTLSFPLAEMYSINVAGPQTITLPSISSGANVGVKVIFRNTGTTYAITFQVSGGTQLIYDLTNTGANSQVLLPLNTYSVTLCSMFVSSTSTYAWFVV